MRRPALALTALVALLVTAAPVAADSWCRPSTITGSHDAFPSYARTLAVADDAVHLVDSRLTGQIEYRRSVDGGGTWSPPVVLAQPDAHFTSVLGDPAVAARGRLVIVAYRANDATAAYLLVRRSVDGGVSWGAPQQVAREVTARRIGEQSVAISAAGAFLAWTDRVTGAIDLRRSVDGGAHFGPVHSLGVTTHTFFPGNPAFTDGMIGLAAAGDAVYLAWSPSGDGMADSIVLSRSRDGGSTFLADETVVDAPSSGWPSLRASGPFLVGEYQAADGTLWVLHSSDRGRHVATSRLAAPLAGETLGEGSVAVDGEGTALATFSRSAVATGDAAPTGDIVARFSEDGGRTWSRARAAARNVSGPGNIGTALADEGALLVYATCQDASFLVCDVAAVRGH